jgi:predicted ArsR family transcriptional regulator
MKCKNWEARQRSRKARYLLRCIEMMGIPHTEVAKALGVHMRRMKQLTICSPQLHVLHELGQFVESRAKELAGRPAASSSS